MCAIDAAAIILRETLGLNVGRALQVVDKLLERCYLSGVHAVHLLIDWTQLGASHLLSVAQVGDLHIAVYPPYDRPQIPFVVPCMWRFVPVDLAHYSACTTLHAD